jgi:hypothetical protein
LILLYWYIGREILRTQKAEGWGTKVVERLAKDLAAEFPEMSGFSSLNLKRMRAFYEAWQPVEIISQPFSKFASPFVSQPVTQLETSPPEPLSLLPWSTNLVLLHRFRGPLSVAAKEVSPN